MDDSAYTSALDMWACGCILAELVLGKLLFNGHDELRVLANIFNIVGFPTEQTWPGVNSLPGSFILKTQQNQERLPLIKTPAFRLEMMGLTNSGFSLLASLLTLDPKKRITAQQALQHPFFSEEPVGTPSLHLSQSRLKEIRARHGERRRLDEDLTPDAAKAKTVTAAETAATKRSASQKSDIWKRRTTITRSNHSKFCPPEECTKLIYFTPKPSCPCGPNCQCGPSSSSQSKRCSPNCQCGTCCESQLSHDCRSKGAFAKDCSCQKEYPQKNSAHAVRDATAQ
ncbi:putative Cyclin-dependent kinase G-2 [Blattamonas nauphoetae]|uniref:Cyclin-dependent kinase G-2 n=1 Tax=Blattamonas nauphoetae TaxID=2049346 RepID=A0ABQ9Y4L0_9EUKA|nr:putative Cyclin-dependent kinase G-2 [Blattamonas nauphoetae]